MGCIESKEKNSNSFTEAAGAIEMDNADSASSTVVSHVRPLPAPPSTQPGRTNITHSTVRVGLEIFLAGHFLLLVLKGNECNDRRQFSVSNINIRTDHFAVHNLTSS